MNSSKYFIFLFFVLLECNYGASARRLNPIGYFPSKDSLKLGLSLSKRAEITSSNESKYEEKRQTTVKSRSKPAAEKNTIYFLEIRLY